MSAHLKIDILILSTFLEIVLAILFIYYRHWCDQHLIAKFNSACPCIIFSSLGALLQKSLLSYSASILHGNFWIPVGYLGSLLFQHTLSVTCWRLSCRGAQEKRSHYSLSTCGRWCCLCGMISAQNVFC